jgi:AraC-like DNA-binding protein
MEMAVSEPMLDLTGALFGEHLDGWKARALSMTESSSLAAALATSLVASELLKCPDIDQVLRSATELARDSIGLERVAFYLREPCAGRLVLRGSWGTGAQGETTDEHGLEHELSLKDGLALQNLRAAGACALYRPKAPWLSVEGGRPVILGEGWVMVTPLISGNDLIGVIYNDTALSHGAVDASKQAALAVLANFVSMEYASRCSSVRWESLRSLGGPSMLVQRVRNAVDQNLATRGNELAAEFGVSPGHLARVFKREMGVSLVEYRNRKRIDRFWDAIQEGSRAPSLKQAAVDAGFGSYAQFNRVHKKFVGRGPGRDERRSSPGLATNAAAPRGPGPWPTSR